MNTTLQIIDRLGGPTAVARALAVGPSTVSEWKRAGSIPVRYWVRLVAHAEKNGIDGLTYEVLVAAHTPSDVSSPGLSSLEPGAPASPVAPAARGEALSSGGSA